MPDWNNSSTTFSTGPHKKETPSSLVCSHLQREKKKEINELKLQKADWC